jgi:hypothetical protein
MPTPISRPSLTTNLADRYATTPVGGAFNVQKTLGSPGSAPKKQSVIEGDTISMKANTFQSPAGFETNVLQQKSQLIDVQSNGNSGVSQFLQGFNNTPYDK